MNRISLLAAGLAFVGAVHAAEPTPVAPKYELALVDMQGQKKVLGTLPGSVVAPRVAPDGRRIAFEMFNTPEPGEPQLTLVYVADMQGLDKKKAMQVTVIARQNTSPVWSPDGDWLAFRATGNAGDTIFWEKSDGWIQPKLLVDGRAPEGLYEGGARQMGLMTFLTLKGDKDYGISMLDIETKKATRLVDLPGSAQHGSEISPDGKWLAYVSDETGRAEVWAEPLPQTGKRFQLTKNGGSHPQWSPDGSKLYFDQAGQIYQLNITGGAEPKASDPVALPIKGFVQDDMRRQYDLTPDGKGFVALFPIAK
jgi:eukaryotic-like serine/threonine-protein kinase